MSHMITKSVLLCLSMLAADDCDDGPKSGDSTVHEMEQTETNQQRLAQLVPPPQLRDSQERRNLVHRLNLVNNPDRISYIHLLSNDGRVVFYSTVKGKVSSLNSLLTTPQQIATIHYSGGYSHFVLPSPDFDGSYGENPHGIFWFDENGTYLEWNGTYFLSDRPMRLSQEPVMMMAVDGRGNAAPVH